MSRLQKKPAAHKRGHPTLQKHEFFILLWVIFALLRTRIRIHWPDWIRTQSGSGSETLLQDMDSLRVLNDIYMKNLSFGLMSWLLAYPLAPLSRQQVVSLFQICCVSPVELSDLLTREGGGRGWARSQIIQPRESLALYKSLIPSVESPGET